MYSPFEQRLLLGAVMLLLVTAELGCAARTDLRIMSFNLRYGSADDGPNHWDRRKELVVQTIEAFAPDVVGVQECLALQARYLLDHMPAYDWVGVGRDDGRFAGEMVAILYRRRRFVRLAAGHFWLSETPEVPGSRSWDSSLTRMVSWVHLRERGSRRAVYIFNTHFDHRGELARAESARLLRRKVRHITGGSPAVVLGDFNAHAGAAASGPYQILIEGDPRWTDTYCATHPQAKVDCGTYHGFRGVSNAQRIDWILVTSGLSVVDAGIVRHHRGQSYPSDHYPVTTVLRWPD